MIQVRINKFFAALAFFTLLLMSSCNMKRDNLDNANDKKYENKKEYRLKKGESFKIYFAVHSGIKYEIINLEELNNIDLISKKSLNLAPKDCDGCTEIIEIKFLVKEHGDDTLKYVILPPNKNYKDGIDSNKIQRIMIRVE